MNSPSTPTKYNLKTKNNNFNIYNFTYKVVKTKIVNKNEKKEFYLL